MVYPILPGYLTALLMLGSLIATAAVGPVALLGLAPTLLFSMGGAF